MRIILRTLALTGVVAAAAVAGQTQAQAQVAIGAPVGGPVYYGGYVPPCPGPDFIWTPGYYAGTVWIPGRWMHRDRYYVEHRDYRFDRHDYDRHDFDHRGWDHGRR
jgi:hypothetical protein